MLEKRFIGWCCLVLCMLVMMSCHDGTVMQESFVEFNPPRSLGQSDTITLQVNIDDNRKPYPFYGVISAEKSFSTLPLRVTEIDPFGEKVMMDIDVILSAKQQEAGEPNEFEFAIDQRKQFHMHGKYTYQFQVRSSQSAPVEGITLFGVRVRSESQK